MALAAVDRDGDGRGEAGTLAELAGRAPLRGADPRGVGRLLDPPLISSGFATAPVQRCGYLFRLWLPAAQGRYVGPECADAADVDASETSFLLYAWPTDDGRGQSAFLVDPTGKVWRCANEGRRYHGLDSPVPVDAALPSSDAGAATGHAGRVGRDGQRWTEVH